MKVVVFLANGFEECEALIVVDILRRAGLETILASVSGCLDVESSRHVVIKSDALAEQVDYCDVELLFLPGGRLGTENLLKSDLVLEKSVEFAKTKMIAAMCAAPSLLAKLGLLEGKKATCHPDYERKMHGAILVHEKVVVEDNIVTGQGLGATFELAFSLVELLTGRDEAQQIKESICY